MTREVLKGIAMKDMGYNLLKSRKFWAAVVGVIYSMIYTVWPDFPVPEESVIGVVGTLVSYILSVALEDGLRGQNGNTGFVYENTEDEAYEFNGKEDHAQHAQE